MNWFDFFTKILPFVWQWLGDYEKHKKECDAIDQELSELRRRRRTLLANLKRCRPRRRIQRSCWVRPELQQAIRFWEDKVHLMSNKRFQEKMRLSRQSFSELVENLRPFLTMQNTIMRQAIPLEKRIAVALYVLKSNADLSVVADLFGIGKSTVGKLLHQFCSAVSNYLYNEFVKFPHTAVDRQRIADGFLKRWQFPGVIGALDGSHIPIIAPTYCHEDYVNYKNYHSIVLMALVDHNYKFTYTNIGKPGRANDASVFNTCGLKDYFEDGKLVVEDKHIIGDGAFPLFGWLLVPFIERFGMPVLEKFFNYRLSRARMVVENAFGRLKGRWRILLKRTDFALYNMNDIVKTCIVLHNICEKNHDTYNADWDRYVLEADRLYPQPVNVHRQMHINAFAKQKRNHIAQCLGRDGIIITNDECNE